MKFLIFLCLASTTLATSYEPTWASITPKRVIQHTDQTGASLVKAVEALKPGDKLEIAAGTYSVERMWDILVSGGASAYSGTAGDGGNGGGEGGKGRHHST